MPYALCPMPYAREHLMLVRKAIYISALLWGDTHYMYISFAVRGRSGKRKNSFLLSPEMLP
jgi:hypothetical protein